jgi:hypothetical protein
MNSHVSTIHEVSFRCANRSFSQCQKAIYQVTVSQAKEDHTPPTPRPQRCYTHQHRLLTGIWRVSPGKAYAIMDVDFWASRVLSSKNLSVVQAASRNSGTWLTSFF